MAIDQRKLEYYLDEAKLKKEEIRSIYNEVLELTDPFSTINDSGVSRMSTQRKIDSSVVSSIDALSSFIMSSVLSKEGQWADIKIDEDRLKAESGEDISGELNEAKKVVGGDVKKVFDYIQGSNYYKEISRAVDSFVKVGTGCYTIRETGTTAKPFIYNYVALDNLYILEDALTQPNIIFKLHPEVNADYLLDVFGEDCILPTEVDVADPNKKTDVYECVIPEYDEANAITIYNYIVITEDLTSRLIEKELRYNPFVLFRWKLIEGSPWGTSVVLSNLSLLQELEEYKEIYKTQARRISNPATMFYGNEELYYNLSLEEGAINFGGNPLAEGHQGGMSPIGNAANLMPLDKLISEARNNFARALMVTSITADPVDIKYTTAQASRALQENFRKIFANTYELINSELLSPTFMSPFIIMMGYNMLNLTEEIVPYTTLKYVNSLSTANDMGDVNNMLQYAQIVAQLDEANKMGVAFKLPETIDMVADKMKIDKTLVPSVDELKQIEEMKAQQVQQEAQMGQINGGVVDEGQI